GSTRKQDRRRARHHIDRPEGPRTSTILASSASKRWCRSSSNCPPRSGGAPRRPMSDFRLFPESSQAVSREYIRDPPDDSQTNATLFRPAARLAGGVDGYQQLGQPGRWSRSWSGYFYWHLDAFLLSIALLSPTIQTFILAWLV